MIPARDARDLSKKFWHFCTQNIPLYKNLPWDFFFEMPYTASLIVDFYIAPCEHKTQIMQFGNLGRYCSMLFDLVEILESWNPVAQIELFHFLYGTYQKRLVAALDWKSPFGAGDD